MAPRRSPHALDTRHAPGPILSPDFRRIPAIRAPGEDRSLNTRDGTGAGSRGRPRLWHHDYLHLRPLARDLERSVSEAMGRGSLRRVLDLGSGASPYRALFGREVDYVRLDLDAGAGPSVVARAEALPFGGGTFDAVLCTQLWGLVDDPRRVADEIARVARGGGRVWISAPAAWPYDSDRPEHRFGVPDLPELFERLRVSEIIPQGGMLAAPFVVVNQVTREAVRAAERRLGPAGRVLRVPAVVVYTVSNALARGLERLARGGPLSSFLGYLDRRMPLNLFVVAEREP